MARPAPTPACTLAGPASSSTGRPRRRPRSPDRSRTPTHGSSTRCSPRSRYSPPEDGRTGRSPRCSSCRRRGPSSGCSPWGGASPASSPGNGRGWVALRRRWSARWPAGTSSPSSAWRRERRALGVPAGRTRSRPRISLRPLPGTSGSCCSSRCSSSSSSRPGHAVGGPRSARRGRSWAWRPSRPPSSCSWAREPRSWWWPSRPGCGGFGVLPPCSLRPLRSSPSGSSRSSSATCGSGDSSTPPSTQRSASARATSCCPGRC